MKVLVIGAALSGTSVSMLLAQKGFEVVLTDMRKIENKSELEKMKIAVYDEGHPAILEEVGWDFIVKNPGIPYHAPFVKKFVEKRIPILNEIEVACHFSPNFRIGAVTGTNGKTTTTTLLGELLKKKNPEHSFAAGNIGLPLSALALEQKSNTCDIALEIAAFQLIGCPNFHPCVSVCMNLTPDHLDYFGSLDRYYEAKMRIYQNQKGEDWFLRNIDDPEIMKRAVNVGCRVVDFSVEREADLCVRNGSAMLYQTRLFDVKDLQLVGRHNLQNALVAAAMAWKMGVPASLIEQGIREFKGVAHRIEFVRELDGVRYYNDSKGTNVDATLVALKAFERPVILLAGGYDKKTGFEGLRPYLDRIKTMIVYGETKDQLKALCPSAIVVDTLKEALQKAREIAVAEDVVLLSPLCASWDQFKNYEQRGDLFKQWVNEFEEL